MFSRIYFDASGFLFGRQNRVKVKKDIQISKKAYATVGALYTCETNKLSFTGDLIFEVAKDTIVKVNPHGICLRREIRLPYFGLKVLLRPTVEFDARECSGEFTLDMSPVDYSNKSLLFFLPAWYLGVPFRKTIPVTCASEDTSGLLLEISAGMRELYGCQTFGYKGCTAIIDLGPPVKIPCYYKYCQKE